MAISRIILITLMGTYAAIAVTIFNVSIMDVLPLIIWTKLISLGVGILFRTIGFDRKIYGEKFEMEFVYIGIRVIFAILSLFIIFNVSNLIDRTGILAQINIITIISIIVVQLISAIIIMLDSEHYIII